MKPLLSTIALLILLVFIASCKKEPEKPPVIIPPDKPYGTAFSNVPAIEDVVMYEVNLRAFSPTGDLRGVIDRLDEIKALGVNVIWLMPIHPVGEINSVNSPYSVKDHTDIGEEYGTIDDLRELTDEAHQREMAVIIDWVANHTAWDNPWISNRQWYTQDANGNIIHPGGTNWLDVADLNYDSQEMQNTMIAAMKFWVWEANIDGFRCDYADGVPYRFWKRAIDTLKSMPEREYILLAEGSRSDHFTAGFDMIYGWDFYYRLIGIFENQDAGSLFSVNTTEMNKAPEGKQILRYSTNHDESAWNKTPMVLFNGKEGALAASVATVFMGGCPLFYTGQEVGTENTVPFFSNSTINWEQNPDMLSAYQEMMDFYTISDVARAGSNLNFQDADVLCFKKNLNSEELLIMINFRDAVIDFTIPAELQNSSWTDAFTETPFAIADQVELNNYQYMILKK